MCIKLHPALQIYIPQSCPSVARILESLIIHFINRLSIVPSILNLSDTDFRVFYCRKILWKLSKLQEIEMRDSMPNRKSARLALFDDSSQFNSVQFLSKTLSSNIYINKISPVSSCNEIVNSAIQSELPANFRSPICDSFT